MVRSFNRPEGCQGVHLWAHLPRIYAVTEWLAEKVESSRPHWDPPEENVITDESYLQAGSSNTQQCAAMRSMAQAPRPGAAQIHQIFQ